LYERKNLRAIVSVTVLPAMNPREVNISIRPVAARERCIASMRYGPPQSPCRAR
jgi:hypothetical protein